MSKNPKKKSDSKTNDESSSLKSRMENKFYEEQVQQMNRFFNRPTDEELLKGLYFNKYTKGYYRTLEDFKRESAIKAIQMQATKGDHLAYLNEQLIKYKEAIPHLSDYTKISEAYKEIVIFIINEINTGLGGASKLEYNPNNFNEDCALLFNYLVENYEKEGNVK